MLKSITFGIASLTMSVMLSSWDSYSTTTDTVGVDKFLEAFKEYVYYIEGVGIVNFQSAAFKNGELITEYYYFSEGENRFGKSSHHLQNNDKYVGNWETSADNGNVYKGTSWLKFNADGTASGKWTWNGIPDGYEIRIDKIKSSIRE